ncbi:MAG: hypothetical protein MUF27_14280 [Acidobacteria bacterium]|nr:hypothetical protein [Acidobacteriota bacterium]
MPECRKPRSVARQPKLGLALAFALAALSAPVRALPPERDAWSELRTPHFVVYSNASERRTREIAIELETMREVMRRVVPDVRRGTLSVDAHLPTQVYLFESARSFQPYRLIPGVAGFFTARPLGNLVAVDVSVDEPLQVVRHEFMHHFVETNIPGVPLWADEGLAEFYSTMTRENEQVLLGRPLPHHVEWLRDHGPMPVDQLIALGSAQSEGDEQEKVGAVYATSWLLVHYLLAGSPARHNQLGNYLARIKDGATAAGAFAAAFRGEPAELDAELAAYARSIQKSYAYWRIPVGDLDVDPPGAPRPMPRAETLARLGILLADPETGSAADAHLDAALALEPELPLALAGKGLVRLAKDDAEGARPLLIRAAAADPSNAQLQYLAALTVMQAASGEGADSAPAAAIPLLERAVASDPRLADAQALLGLALAVDPARAAEATRALEGALQMSPARSDVALALSALYLNAGRLGEAEGLALRVQRTERRPELQAEAERQLAAVQSRRAVELFNQGLKQFSAGQRDEALRTMQEAADAAQDPVLRVELKRRLEELRDRSSAAPATETPSEVSAPAAAAGGAPPPSPDVDRRSQLIKRYNEAVARANKGDLAGALALMKEVEKQAAAASDQFVLPNAQRLVKKWSGKLAGRK